MEAMSLEDLRRSRECLSTPLDGKPEARKAGFAMAE